MFLLRYLFLFLFSISALGEENSLSIRDGLTIPLVVKKESISMDLETVTYLIKHGKINSYIEPIMISIKKDDFLDFLSKNIKPRNKRLFLKAVKQNKLYKDEKLTINLKIKKFFKETYFKDFNKSLHYHLYIDGKNFSDKGKLKIFLQQASLVLDKKEISKLRKNIENKKMIDIEKSLLPKFPKKYLKKYSVYKGPNCFHAALSFHDNLFTKSTYYNKNREEKHHSAMINNDELLMALKEEFYEITSSTVPIGFGDIIVFANISKEFSYKDIQHASVYLFNNYVYSKGSKYSKTPYSIKPLSIETKAWAETGKMTLKVFRRKSIYGTVPLSK